MTKNYPADSPAPDALDVVIAHPVYGSLGWLAVNNPGPATAPEVRLLLEQAHHLAPAATSAVTSWRGGQTSTIVRL